MTVKLLVDRKARKVLLAEGGKDVVDFIFTFLALPVGTVIKLLSQDPIAGSIIDLYKSVEALSTTYIEEEGKNFLLGPKIASSPRYNKQPLLLEHISSTSDSPIYTCPSNQCNNYYSEVSGTRCGNYYSEVSGTRCSRCSMGMTRKMIYVSPSANAGTVSGSGEGFVKGVETYILMDDLSVSPMSSISAIALLTKFNVKDLSVLEERAVKLGMDEGLELLRASFESKTALTDVFLRNELKISSSS